MIDKKTGIQYVVMGEEMRNEEGKYVPDFEELIMEAPNEEMKKEWQQCQKLMKKMYENEEHKKYAYFAFNAVWLVKRSCGHYEILQHHCHYVDNVLQYMEEVEMTTKCSGCHYPF